MNKEKALKNQGLEFREDIRFKGGLNVTMKLVNKAGNVVKIYVDSVLFGAELVKYTEE